MTDNNNNQYQNDFQQDYGDEIDPDFDTKENQNDNQNQNFKIQNKQLNQIQEEDQDQEQHTINSNNNMPDSGPSAKSNKQNKSQNSNNQSARKSIGQKEGIQITNQSLKKNANFDNNQRVLQELYTANDSKIQKILQELFQEQPDLKAANSQISLNNSKQNKNSKVLSSKDLPLILRKYFALQKILTFYKEGEKDEMVQSSNSNHKFIMESFKRFCQNSNILQINNYKLENYQDLKLDLQEFKQFLKYLIEYEDILLKNKQQQQQVQDEKEKDKVKDKIKEKEKPIQETESQPQKPIINQPRRSTLEDIQNNNLIEEIQASIKRYQKILQDTKDIKESQIILSTITSLKEQLINLQKMGTSSNNNNTVNQSYTDVKRSTGMSNITNMTRMTKENIRKRNMKFLFLHYAKQQYFAGVQHTFDRIQEEKNLLNAQKIALFLNDFKIINHNRNVQKKDIPTIFKLATNNQKNMNFEEFRDFLERLGVQMYKDQGESYPLEGDKIEALYKFINIDDLNEIKNKCKTQSSQNPFNIKDRDGFRLLPQDVGREIKLKKLDQSVLENIKQKKIKDKQKELQEMDQNNNKANQSFFNQYKKNTGFQNTNQSFIKNNLGNKSFSDVGQQSFLGKSKLKYHYDNYSQRKVANQEQKSKQKSVFTWSELDQSTYKDLKLNQVGTFRPEDLIEETDDDEDQLYLQQFKITKQSEVEKKEQQEAAINVEKYGVINEKLRPTQKYMLQNTQKSPQKQYNNMGNQNQILNNLHQRQNYSVDVSKPTNQYNTNNNYYIDSHKRNLTGYSQSPQGYQLQRGKNSISQQYLKRAKQIEGQSKIKQQNQINQIIQQQNNYSTKSNQYLNKQNMLNQQNLYSNNVSMNYAGKF